MAVRSSHFQDAPVLLDGNEYTDCEFRKCVLIFKAEAPFALNGCRLTECRFDFQGAAGVTIAFLKKLFHSGGRDVVEEIIRTIR
jgi:hypothetical protein